MRAAKRTASRWLRKLRGGSDLSTSRSHGPSWFVPCLSVAIPEDQIDAGDCAFAESDDPVIVSYATRATGYADSLDRLRSQCEGFGLNTSFETIPNWGRIAACLFKPAFLKFKLVTLGSPIIWLDADSAILKPFGKVTSAFDIGFLPNNRSEESNEMAAVCLMIYPTRAALRFLEVWESLCAHSVAMPGLDHRRLNYTRQILKGSFAESDITSIVTGCLVRDLGKSKEHRF